MTQKERQERSKKEIFKAAMEEFGTYGYEAVTMDSICSRHGISKGMMYHYYANKDELFLLCVEDMFRSLAECVEENAGAESGGVRNAAALRLEAGECGPLSGGDGVRASGDAGENGGDTGYDSLWCGRERKMPMKIIISPAKKMNVETDIFPAGQLPHFLKEAEYLKTYMQSLSYAEAKKIWNCNDKIAELNYERFRHMNLKRGLTPAILSYEGIQYQYMAPMVMEAEALKYLAEHLRILSGFYGVLKPFDGVVPYRLEMQAKLEKAFRRSGQCTEAEEKSITAQEEKEGGVAGENAASLYQFWGSRLYEYLETEEFRGQGYVFREDLSAEDKLVFVK